MCIGKPDNHQHVGLAWITYKIMIWRSHLLHKNPLSGFLTIAPTLNSNHLILITKFQPFTSNSNSSCMQLMNASFLRDAF